MPGPVLHLGAVAQCPHGGMLNIIAASPRVLLGGLPAAVVTDQGIIAGCVFTLPGKPQPCLTTQWLMGATRVFASGQPVLINPPVALCLSADMIPAGPPIISSSQVRVVAM